MPRSSDVVIVGGGVIGLTIARRLAREGMSITLVERDACGRSASWAGAGVLAPPNPHRKDAAAALHLRSLSMYFSFCTELLEETGVDPEYDRGGELEIAFDEAGLSNLRSDVAAAAGRRLPDGRRAYEMHDVAETRRLAPFVAPQALGSMECRAAAQVRNPRLLQALEASCRKAGVDIRVGTPVGDLLLEADRVRGVQTDAGDWGAKTVILCAGAWSSQIGSRLRELMPVRPIRGQMILLKLDRRPFTTIVSRGKTYLVPRLDGHVLLGATEEPEAEFLIRNTAQGLAGLIEKGVKLVPSLSDAPIEATWAGLRPGTPDDLPYIGTVPTMPGLIAATGHFRSGLGLAPATAEVVASLIHNRPYDLDLACCKPGRLSAKIAE